MTGVQRSQTLCGPDRQRGCLHVGLEQVSPAGHKQCEREGVHALRGEDAQGSSQGCQLWVVAYTVSGRCRIQFQACLDPMSAMQMKRWDSFKFLAMPGTTQHG